MRLCVLLILSLSSWASNSVEIIAEIPSSFQAIQSRSLSNNSFVVKSWNENDTEIWRVNPVTELPETWLTFNEVKLGSEVAPTFFATDDKNWWVGGVRWDYFGTASAESIVIANYQSDRQVQYVEVPAHASQDLPGPYIYDWFYATDADVLIGVVPLRADSDNLLLLCHQAKTLAAENCSFHNVLQGELLVTEHNIVVYSNDTIAVYELIGGFQLVYETTLPDSISNVSYWPGTSLVQLQSNELISGVSNSLYWKIDLNAPVSMKPSGPQNVGNQANCLFLSQSRAICKDLMGRMTVVARNSSENTSLSFDYQGEHGDLPYGELMAVTKANRLVTATQDELLVFTLPLPQAEPGILPGPIALYYKEHYSFNLADLFSNIDLDNISLEMFWRTSGGTALDDVLQKVANFAYSFNTSKEVARVNPVGILQFGIADGLWKAFYNVDLQIININDAPVAIAAVVETEPLTAGTSYELDLSDIFSDADYDALIFKSDDIPPEFAIIGWAIRVTPKQAGTFSFTVSATDPAGLSASATISGVVKNQSSSSGNNTNASGGAISWLMLLGFCWILLNRQQATRSSTAKGANWGEFRR